MKHLNILGHQEMDYTPNYVFVAWTKHKFRTVFKAIVAVCLLMLNTTSFAIGHPVVLILHDSSGPYAHLGSEYALLLENLLGHFSAEVTKMPVTDYSSGQIDQHDAIFYIGSTYEEWSYHDSGSVQASNYDAFLADVATTTKTVAWMNYNLWKLAWEWDPAWGVEGFEGKFGFRFDQINNVSLFNRIGYNGVELYKGVVPWANPGAVLTGCTLEQDGVKWACAPELNQVTVLDPAKAQVHATASSTLTTTDPAPYITRSGNLYFVGDIPFSFLSEEDRYLVVADILHDVLNIQHPQSYRAIVRLEDVSPATEVLDMNDIAAVFEREDIRFAVATISEYHDPDGVNSGGTPEELGLPNSDMGSLLEDLYTSRAASIIAHGKTHQCTKCGNNPYNMVSGDDFEFYRVTVNDDNSLNYLGPVPGDSSSWARRRINSAKRLLQQTGLEAFAWEAPHYMASEVDYSEIQSIYPVHYGRLIYFNAASPAGQFVGQFFPYMIEQDHYGYRIVPESIGNIEPDPILGYRPVFPDDLIRHAEKLKVVRDGVASFYYHPFLGTTYLEETIAGLKALGFQFVAPCALVDSCLPDSEPPPPPPPGGLAHVGDLDGASTPAPRGNKWNAAVTITVHDASELLLSGVTVSGSWSGGANGGGSCTTDGGVCEISKNNLKNNVNSVIFMVTDIVDAAGTSIYAGDPVNHDPDSDSDGTTITMLKP